MSHKYVGGEEQGSSKMAQENQDGGLISRYLLGRLQENELEQLEERMMVDTEFYEQVLLAEDEMIEAYVNSELGDSDRAEFEASFLSTPEGRRKVSYATALRKYVQDFPSSPDAEREVSEESVAKPQIAERPLSAGPRTSKNAGLPSQLNRVCIFLRPRFAIPSVAILLLALLGLSYFIIHNRSGFRSGDSELAQLNQRDLSNLSEITDISRLTLVSEATRDSSMLRTVSLTNLSELVLLRLALPPSITGDKVRVNINSDNGTQITLENIRVYPNQAGRDVRVLVPRANLAVGSYVVEIVAGNSTTSGATYHIHLEP
jgi:hypothetical protein